ncbi:MAG: hypothetical protein ACE148_13325 [Vicinamibacterales bacterium]
MTGLHRGGPAREQAPPPVLVALVLGAFLGAVVSMPGCRPAEPPSSSSPSNPIEPLEPSGDVTRPFAFEWRGGSRGPEQTVYRVSVFDTAERLLHWWDTRSTRVEPPRDLDEYFRNGGSFLWKVEELDRNGRRPSAETPLTRFNVRGHEDTKARRH